MTVLPVVFASCLLLNTPLTPSTGRDKDLQHHMPPSIGREKVVSVSGAAGGSVELPCCLDPRAAGDKPKLILWYKAGVRSPLFSHDGRTNTQKSPSQYEVKVDQEVRISPSSATLSKQHLTEQDAGLYECRVDFYRSPTLTAMYNLTILLPAVSLEVEGWGGEATATGDFPSVDDVVAGPFFEGHKLHLSCTARGGYPRPNVTWWRGESLVDRGWEVKGPGMVCNDLVVPLLSRQWFTTQLTCRASTTPKIRPLSVTLTIDMNLLPSTVTVAADGVAAAGEPLRLRCLARGSRPAAVVVWSKNGQHLQEMTTTESWPSTPLTALSTYETVSIVTFNATHHDDGANITCAASNIAIPGSQPVLNTTRLNVLYPPVVTATLGRTLDPARLVAGDDVYLTCHVKANPAPGPVLWYREGVLQEPDDGVILTGSNLVLQKVSRHKAGSYWCSSSNSLEKVTSVPVMLNLGYPPECRSTDATLFIYDQPINVTCQVEASPPVKNFHWQWNFTSEGFSFRLLTEATSGGGSSQWSVVQITARPDGEAGARELFCYGINDVGMQEQPCKFLVKVASAPPPLSSCRLLNITSSSLAVACDRLSSPANGTTVYRAEVYLQDGEIFANVSSSWPMFHVDKLDPATTYNIKVYVSRGPSTFPPILVSALTSSTSSGYTEPQELPNASSVSSHSSSLHFLGWSLGASLLVVMTLQLYCRGRRNNWWRCRRAQCGLPTVEFEGKLLPARDEGCLTDRGCCTSEGRSDNKCAEDNSSLKWELVPVPDPAPAPAPAPVPAPAPPRAPATTPAPAPNPCSGRSRGKPQLPATSGQFEVKVRSFHHKDFVNDRTPRDERCVGSGEGGEEDTEWAGASLTATTARKSEGGEEYTEWAGASLTATTARKSLRNAYNTVPVSDMLDKKCADESSKYFEDKARVFNTSDLATSKMGHNDLSGGCEKVNEKQILLVNAITLMAAEESTL